MKAIFIEMAKDAFAFWEGQRDIRGTALEGTPMWNFGHSFLGTAGDGWGERHSAAALVGRSGGV